MPRFTTHYVDNGLIYTRGIDTLVNKILFLDRDGVIIDDVITYPP